MVAATDVLTLAGEGEREVAAAAVEVIVYGALEMSYSRGAGLVGAESERFGRRIGAVGFKGCRGGRR